MTRRPLVVGVTELRRRHGVQREVQVAGVLPGLEVSSAHVPEGAEVSLTGVMEAIEGGISLLATLRAPWTADCRRCLQQIDGTISTEVREIFEQHPTEGETYPIDGDEVDLEPVVRDAVLLALPLAPLCRDECTGPAPEAFPTGPAVPEPDEAGEEDGAGSGAKRDPRWAALDELRFEE